LTTLKPDINVDAITVDGLVLTFQFFIPSQKDGIQYPMIPPMVAIECKWLPCEILNAITREAAQKIVENLGQPLIYEVISHVSEVLSEIIQDFVVVEEEDNASRLVDIESASVANEHTMQEPKEILPSQRRQRSTNRNSLSSEELIKESKRLKDWENNLETSKAHSHMRQNRAKLPAASKRADVLHVISGSQVIVIMGSTGCGKSTQIPQYLLEEYIRKDKGGSCNIICTQPRRISAVGLATRVAAERSEKVGSTVGYSVRLDSKQSKETRILFCTTGVMLRRLLSDPMLSNVTHVVLDEVHERTIESDLLLLLLRELLRSGTYF
jgi:ATP-dependent RNA helicase DHX57